MNMAVNTLQSNNLYNSSLETPQIQNDSESACIEQVSLWQRNCPCPICKVKCIEGTERILCKTCHNWFHFDCAGLSKTSYDKFLLDPNKMFLCKVCKIKMHCINCNSSLKSPRESIYCVGCLDKCCKSCLKQTVPDIQIFSSTEKAYFCHECTNDHFCNVCNKLCIDGCILCDSCHSWVHYRCTKLKKSQIISYAKTSKKYYCTICIVQNVPFSKESNSNLCTLYKSERLLQSNQDIQLSSQIENVACNLCLECNPECTVCCDNTCADSRRICSTCLICSYVLDKNEFNSVYNEYSLKFHNLVSTIHFNARSLSKNLKSISSLVEDSNINFDLIGITETKIRVQYNVDSSHSNDESESDVSSLKIPGYEFVHTPTNFAFGGAGLYVSQKMNFVRRHDLEFKIESCETCFVELTSLEKNKNVIVAVIYRHPHNNFDPFFSEITSNL